MRDILLIVVYIALALHVFMGSLAVWRVWRGDNVIDRLMAVELVATLTLAILVLISLIERESIYIDVAVGLAALGFISTIALTKYGADEQMF